MGGILSAANFWKAMLGRLSFPGQLVIEKLPLLRGGWCLRGDTLVSEASLGLGCATALGAGGSATL